MIFCDEAYYRQLPLPEKWEALFATQIHSPGKLPAQSAPPCEVFQPIEPASATSVGTSNRAGWHFTTGNFSD